jgi:ribosomal protein L16
MILQPRTTRHKKLHKTRSITIPKKTPNLNYGTSGLLLLQPLRLSSKHLSKFKLYLKRAMRKTDKTKRFVWFHGFPHLPLTKKSPGSRMGKGKGKVEIWFCQLRPLTFLFEFVNLRSGRARFFFKQMSHRLQIPTKFIFQNKKYISGPCSNSNKHFFKVFW